MNNAMSPHTRKLAIKLAFSIVLFVITATSLAAMTRYREAMRITVIRHHSLTNKLDQMRRLIVDERDVIGRFKRLLPADFGVKSPGCCI